MANVGNLANLPVPLIATIMQNMPTEELANLMLSDPQLWQTGEPIIVTRTPNIPWFECAHAQQYPATILHWAAWTGNDAFINGLRTPPQAAQQGFKHGLVVDQLITLANGTQWRTTPLHLAARAGRSSTVELLLQYGAAVDERSDTPRTLCGVAPNTHVHYGEGSALWLACFGGNSGAVKRLLAAGASITLPPHTNAVARLNGMVDYQEPNQVGTHTVKYLNSVQAAARSGHPRVLDRLLDVLAPGAILTDATLAHKERSATTQVPPPANVAQWDTMGRDALHWAAWAGDADGCERLISEFAADQRARWRETQPDVEYGATALQVYTSRTRAYARQHLLAFLNFPVRSVPAAKRPHPASEVNPVAQRSQPECLPTTLINIICSREPWAHQLYYVQGSHAKTLMVQQFLEWLKQQPRSGARRFTAAEFTAYIDYQPMNAQGNLQNTALMEAAERGYNEIVMMLMSAGAGVGAVNSANETVFHILARQGFIDIIRNILEHMFLDSERSVDESATAYQAPVVGGQQVGTTPWQLAVNVHQQLTQGAYDPPIVQQRGGYNAVVQAYTQVIALLAAPNHPITGANALGNSGGRVLRSTRRNFFS